MQPTSPNSPQKTKQKEAVFIAICPYEEALPLSLQDNKAQVHSANSDSDHYPMSQTVKTYILFGSLISSMLLMPLLTIQSQGATLTRTLISLPIHLLFVVICTILAGFLIANFRLHRDAKGLFWSAVIGAGITLNTFNTIGSSMLVLIVLTLLGALGAVLTGLKALPQPASY